jgi:hypothetical protein
MNKKEINNKTFKYILDQTQFVHKNECLLNNTQMIQNNFRSIIRPNINLVDIESDLTNRSRFLSKCPSKKFNPSNQKTSSDINKKICK